MQAIMCQESDIFNISALFFSRPAHGAASGRINLQASGTTKMW
jgi:hypothetical protein